MRTCQKNRLERKGTKDRHLYHLHYILTIKATMAYCLVEYCMCLLFIHTAQISGQVTDHPASTDVNTSEHSSKRSPGKFCAFLVCSSTIGGLHLLIHDTHRQTNEHTDCSRASKNLLWVKAIRRWLSSGDLSPRLESSH